jgi:cyclase
MTAFDFKKGLLKLGEGVWAYIQPDGSWGLNNAGLVTDKGASLLVDTHYDLDLTREMLAATKEKAGVSSFDRLVNTHKGVKSALDSILNCKRVKGRLDRMP